MTTVAANPALSGADTDDLASGRLAGERHLHDRLAFL